MVLLAVGPMAYGQEKEMSDQMAARAATKAPQCPALSGLDLKTRLIDYVDCADPSDPHPFMDQGTSRVVRGPAGTYRVSAPHAHSFFGYRIRSAGKDRPVLVVFEYPDDADRNIGFFTAESGLTGGVNADWGLETGAYTGWPYPLSNRMQYHTFVWWPQDDWPAVIVVNFNRFGDGAAASRIWVFAIEGALPKLEVPEPDPFAPRRLGHYNSRGYYLAQRLYFGLRSPNAVEHMLDYFDYIGVNELSWGVCHSDDATIPSWGLAGTHLDEVLAAMDRRGRFSFTACLYPAQDIRVGGKRLSEMTKEEYAAALIKGCEEFLDRYGRYRSLRGITIGAMYGIEPVAEMLRRGVARDVVDAIRKKRPDIEVATYLGGRALHDEYFAPPSRGSSAPSAEQVCLNWEASGKNWSDWLGEQALACWKAWGQDPESLRGAGFTVYEQMQPDDFRVFQFYGSAQNPRSLIYFDLDRSQKRSDLISSPYAALWNTHFEGHIGLVKDYNFWFTKAWVAPDFSPPPPWFLAPFATALALRDRQVIIPGSWNVRYFGHEADSRRFARAFRSLPPVEMKEAPSPVDSVVVRWAVYSGKRYVSAVSRIPFASQVTIDGETVSLPPYELVSFADSRTSAPRVEASACAEYRRYLEDRISRLESLINKVRALDPSAAPDIYRRTAQRARDLIRAGKLYEADITAAPGLVNELELRGDILDRPRLSAPRVAAAPPMNGNLNDWPAGASDIKADTGAELACHMYFPNSWTGPDDLSARVRLCHDGQRLYLGVEVKDQKVVSEKVQLYRGRNRGREVTHEDGLVLKLSTQAYRDWKAPNDGSCRPEIVWSVQLPFSQEETRGQGRQGFSYVCRKTPSGYVMEGSAPLSELGVSAGGSVGFLVMVSDYDEYRIPNLADSAWAAKQVLLVPHKPNFVYYEDARTCGRLELGR